MSRENHPKQLLSLLGGETLIQRTLMRYADRSRFSDPIVVTSESIRFTVDDQIRSIGVVPWALVVEPFGRGTAPAIAVAALLAEARRPGAVIVVSPADHVIPIQEAFLSAVAMAVEAAAERRLVALSVVPLHAETAYGYILRGQALEGGACKIEKFTEKPNADAAQAMLADQRYHWNSGIFAFSAAHFIEELGIHAPEVLAAASAAAVASKLEANFIRLDPECFGKSPNISVDYAVMEKSESAVAVPLDAGWSDIGSWSELWKISPKDDNGNVCNGDVVLQDSHNCLVISSNRLAAVSGVQDLSVVVTDDAVLVSSHARAQEVRAIADDLREAKRSEISDHRRVVRPWGYYESVHAGDQFQVKRITVKPGGRLSLQKHSRRAEHWVVVEGVARATLGDKVRVMKENESMFIPVGEVHRLENPTERSTTIIEVQLGSYLGEDDIVRLEDEYGRSEWLAASAAE
jgi:mannose-1-phosphate guanylyltransferase/mannose-6-phosphate isomerase